MTLAGTKISDYPDGGTPAAGDKFIIARGGNNYSIDAMNLPNLELSNDDPEPVGGAASPGISTKVSRADHVHVGGSGGGYTYSAISPTTSNVSASEGTFYDVNMSGLTADRDFNLPTPSASGKFIKVRINTGNDTYELIFKKNGVEITRCFISGEILEFISTGTGAGDWAVAYDGRIPCRTQLRRITSNANTTHAAATFILADWNDASVNVGNCADLTNKRVTARRAAKGHIVSGGFSPAAGIPDQEYGGIRVYKNGTAGEIVGTVALRQSAASPNSVFGSVLAPKMSRSATAVGDYFEYYFITQSANIGLRRSDESTNVVLKEMTYFEVEEVLLPL